MKAWQQVFAILAEAKRDGLAFEAAWYRAMESLKPERSCPPHIRKVLDEERDLLREGKPFWRAAYENRDLAAEELERASAEVEKRLDSVLCQAA